jgi:hypothetical protein
MDMLDAKQISEESSYIRYSRKRALPKKRSYILTVTENRWQTIPSSLTGL